MGWIESSVFLAIQLCAFGLVCLGLSNMPAFVEVVRLAIANGDWKIAVLGPKLIAITAPTLFGGWVFAGIQAYVRYAAETAPLEKAHPNKPWMWRPDWAEGRVRLSNRTVWIGLAVMWSFFLLFAVPGALTLMALKNFEQSITIFLCCFVGFMGLIFAAFSKQASINRKWNNSELRLASVPGVIGGPISGVVVLADQLPADSIFRVTLVCERSYTSRRVGTASDDSTSLRTETLWQSQKMLNRTIDPGVPGATGLPFHFAIDYECQPTGRDSFTSSSLLSKRRTSENINWYVSVALRDDRQMREAKFEVPVFRTPESSPSYVEDESLVKEYLVKPEPSEVLTRVGFARREVPGGFRLEFSFFSWFLLFGLLVFLGMCVGGIAAAVILAKAIEFKLAAAAIPAVLTAILVYCLFEMCLWRSAVTVLSDRIDIEAGWLGFQHRASHPRGKPLPLGVSEEFKKSDGAWWRVHFVDERSQAHAIVSRLDGKQEADAIRDWLQRQVS